jgi:hypothetical protein
LLGNAISKQAVPNHLILTDIFILHKQTPRYGDFGLKKGK